MSARPERSKVADWFAEHLGFQDTLFYNRAAYVMIAASFGLAAVICIATDEFRPNSIMAVGGPIAIFLDIAYRLRNPRHCFLPPDGGGRFLIVPIYVFGLIWFLAGYFEVVK